MPPWQRDIGRALLQMPTVYFFDTGLVRGDDGARLENAVATMLLKYTQYLQDAHGKDSCLHYIRTKDGAEVDFALSDGDTLTDLIECKVADSRPHRALVNFAVRFPEARPVQLVRDLRQEEFRNGVAISEAGVWLSKLAAEGAGEKGRGRRFGQTGPPPSVDCCQS